MKRAWIAAALVSATAGFAGPATARADTGEAGADDGPAELATVDELRPPSAPAFSLLGVSPTEIDRPRTPSALMASLGAEIGTSLPSSLALEVSPYWLFDHSRLSLKAFADSEHRMARLLSSLSVNLATSKTTQTAMDGTTDRTDLSAGLSLIPLRSWSTCTLSGGPQMIRPDGAGLTLLLADEVRQACSKPPPSTECAGAIESFEVLRRVQTEDAAEQRDREADVSRLGSILSKLAGDAKSRCTASAAVKAQAPEVGTHTRRCLEEVDARIEAARTELARFSQGSASSSDVWSNKLEACERAFWTPKGLVVSLAFATAWRFEDSQWNRGQYLRSALWLSTGLEGADLSFLVLGRLQWESGGYDGPAPDLGDVGGRLIFHRRSWSTSVEGVKRFALSSGLTGGFRLALIGEAKVGSQWLTLSIGKDYDSTRAGSFFALANFAMTIGDPKLASN